MGVETKITCDVCGKETGAEGSGSAGEYIDCHEITPGGWVHAIGKSKTRWAICSDCWWQMWRTIREQNVKEKNNVE